MDIKNTNSDKYGRIEEVEEINENKEIIKEDTESKKRGWKSRRKKKIEETAPQIEDLSEEKNPDETENADERKDEDFAAEYPETEIEEVEENEDTFEGIDVSKYLTEEKEDESVDDILKSMGMLPEEETEEQEIENEKSKDAEEEEISEEEISEEENESLDDIEENGKEECERQEIEEAEAEETSEEPETPEENEDTDIEEKLKDDEIEEDILLKDKEEKKSPKKKEKKVKEKKAKEEKEKKEKEPLAKKDYITIVIAVIAVLAISAFTLYYFKGAPDEGDATRETVTEKDHLSDVQIIRAGTMVDLIQSDIPDVFYGVATDYSIRYYQYYEKEMHAARATNNVSLTVDLGSASIPVKIDYVELGGRVFGFGLFTANENSDVYYYDMVAFKITDLPKKYRKDGHALLVATSSKNALTSNAINWTESFDLNLETGETTRFLKIINRRTDTETGNYESNFCLMPWASYTSSSEMIPFFSSREYPLGVDMQDIFVKTGAAEKILASDVYGKYFVMDGDTVIYMRKTTTGFNLIYNTKGEEEVKQSFYGFMNSSYINYKEYILGKADGKLYNLKTLETKTLVGYSMSNPDYFCVSDDGKYLIVIGTVKNALDYQVQMFNLETGEYAKMEDKNYSQHSNLCFIDNTTASYCVLDPNQGFEYVVLDIEKAFD